MQLIEEVQEGRLLFPATALQFLLAGNATFTLVSKKTDKRYTYKVRQKEGQEFWFVSLLTEADNQDDNSYMYMGHIRSVRNSFTKSHKFVWTRGEKSKLPWDHPAVKAFQWLWAILEGSRDKVVAMRMWSQIEVWHEGKCGRCGRKLTVPDSIASGYGPECINHVVEE